MSPFFPVQRETTVWYISLKFVRRKIKRDIKSQNAKIKIGIHIFGRIVHIGSKALLGWEKIANDFKF